ncbi:polysaccharide deacetylase family protein [Clostridium sp. PL3]|uniref:Polysaccharide deacetylase family protein n=1 Tax=Clostridium thailandense TaxID=2794346 RepID=A0A949TRV4_9CLOT|nr:polysaccharide deacetylase family protein [Clostridium thailandense]MBV7275402.1 polysaccharide deacetylase family protein [Clostridium thailandense]
MDKLYKRIALILGVSFMIGLVGYRLVGYKKVEFQNKQAADKITNTTKKVSEGEKDKNQSATGKNNVKKEREFKEVPLKQNDKSVPVLMYHSIDYEKGNELRVPKEKFREQMQYLKDNGYTTLTFDELYDFLVNNKPVPEKSVVITFDDGYEDNYQNAYPILKEFGFNAAVFVITNAVDNEKPFLTSEQLNEMEKNGIEIESHTLAHDELNKLSYDKQVTTLKGSKAFIEKTLNKQVKYIAYPFGKWNDDTIKALKDTGYDMAFTTVSGWSDKSQGMYTLSRVYISANYDINEFKRRLTNPKY